MVAFVRYGAQRLRRCGMPVVSVTAKGGSSRARIPQAIYGIYSLQEGAHERFDVTQAQAEDRC
jgi:hypothetical protein